MPRQSAKSKAGLEDAPGDSKTCALCGRGHNMSKRHAVTCCLDDCKKTFHLDCMFEATAVGIGGMWVCDFHEPRPELPEQLPTTLSGLHTALSSLDVYRWYTFPVDIDAVPDYYKKISRPMDLSTIQWKVEEGKYTSVYSFRRDFEQIMDNAMVFNLPSTIYYQEAELIKALGSVYIQKAAASLGLPMFVADEEREQMDAGAEKASTALRTTKPKSTKNSKANGSTKAAKNKSVDGNVGRVKREGSKPKKMPAEEYLINPYGVANVNTYVQGPWRTEPYKATQLEEVLDHVLDKDAEIIQDKLSTDKKAQCGDCCCTTRKGLGDFDYEKHSFSSTCPDRMRSVECDDNCGCGPGCHNRQVGNHKSKSFGTSQPCESDLLVRNVWGFDAFTRRNIFLSIKHELENAHSEQQALLVRIKAMHVGTGSDGGKKRGSNKVASSRPASRNSAKASKAGSVLQLCDYTDTHENDRAIVDRGLKFDGYLHSANPGVGVGANTQEDVDTDNFGIDTESVMTTGTNSGTGASWSGGLCMSAHMMNVLAHKPPTGNAKLRVNIAMMRDLLDSKIEKARKMREGAGITSPANTATTPTLGTNTETKVEMAALQIVNGNMNSNQDVKSDSNSQVIVSANANTGNDSASSEMTTDVVADAPIQSVFKMEGMLADTTLASTTAGKCTDTTPSDMAFTADVDSLDSTSSKMVKMDKDMTANVSAKGGMGTDSAALAVCKQEDIVRKVEGMDKDKAANVGTSADTSTDAAVSEIAEAAAVDLSRGIKIEEDVSIENGTDMTCALAGGAGFSPAVGTISPLCTPKLVKGTPNTTPIDTSAPTYISPHPHAHTPTFTHTASEAVDMLTQPLPSPEPPYVHTLLPPALSAVVGDSTRTILESVVVGDSVVPSLESQLPDPSLAHTLEPPVQIQTSSSYILHDKQKMLQTYGNETQLEGKALLEGDKVTSYNIIEYGTASAARSETLQNECIEVELELDVSEADSKNHGNEFETSTGACKAAQGESGSSQPESVEPLGNTRMPSAEELAALERSVVSQDGGTAAQAKTEAPEVDVQVSREEYLSSSEGREASLEASRASQTEMTALIAHPELSASPEDSKSLQGGSNVHSPQSDPTYARMRMDTTTTLPRGSATEPRKGRKRKRESVSMLKKLQTGLATHASKTEECKRSLQDLKAQLGEADSSKAVRGGSKTLHGGSKAPQVGSSALHGGSQPASPNRDGAVEELKKQIAKEETALKVNEHWVEYLTQEIAKLVADGGGINGSCKSKLVDSQALPIDGTRLQGQRRASPVRSKALQATCESHGILRAEISATADCKDNANKLRAVRWKRARNETLAEVSDDRGQLTSSASLLEVEDCRGESARNSQSTEAPAKTGQLTKSATRTESTESSVQLNAALTEAPDISEQLSRGVGGIHPKRSAVADQERGASGNNTLGRMRRKPSQIDCESKPGSTIVDGIDISAPRPKRQRASTTSPVVKQQKPPVNPTIQVTSKKLRTKLRLKDKTPKKVPGVETISKATTQLNRDGKRVCLGKEGISPTTTGRVLKAGSDVPKRKPGRPKNKTKAANDVKVELKDGLKIGTAAMGGVPAALPDGKAVEDNGWVSDVGVAEHLVTRSAGPSSGLVQSGVMTGVKPSVKTRIRTAGKMSPVSVSETAEKLTGDSDRMGKVEVKVENVDRSASPNTVYHANEVDAMEADPVVGMDVKKAVEKGVKNGIRKSLKRNAFKRGVNQDGKENGQTVVKKEVNRSVGSGIATSVGDTVVDGVRGLNVVVKAETASSKKPEPVPWYMNMPPEQELNPTVWDDEIGLFIDNILLRFGNNQDDRYCYDMAYVLKQIIASCDISSDARVIRFCFAVLKSIDTYGIEAFKIHPKGAGIVCNTEEGLRGNEFIVEFYGEVYSPWRWFEKQDIVKKMLRKGSLPEFYNMMLERHRDDAKGFDVLFVDPTNRGTYGSRLSHSCDPNCATHVMAVNGRFVLAVYTVRDIKYGEELCFDYNSVTESIDEYRKAVCLCGTSKCRQSFLYFANSATFQCILAKYHSTCDRTGAILMACSSPELTEDDRQRLSSHDFNASVLTGCPDWLQKWASLILKFIEYERMMMPHVLTADFKDDFGHPYTLESAGVEAAGVHGNREQNLAITLDKIKYILRQQPAEFADTMPLRPTSPQEISDYLWRGKESIVKRTYALCSKKLGCSKLKNRLRELAQTEISGVGHEPMKLAQKVLMNMRAVLMEAQKLKPTERHYVVADILFLIANTETYFTKNEYKNIVSDTVEITAADVGAVSRPKQPIKGKKYNNQHIWGQLHFWDRQTINEPDQSLTAARYGPIVMPELESAYAPKKVYSRALRNKHIENITVNRSQQWNNRFPFSYRNAHKIYGTPMMDVAMGAKTVEEYQNLMRDLLHERVKVTRLDPTKKGSVRDTSTVSVNTTLPPENTSTLHSPSHQTGADMSASNNESVSLALQAVEVQQPTPKSDTKKRYQSE